MRGRPYQKLELQTELLSESWGIANIDLAMTIWMIPEEMEMYQSGTITAMSLVRLVCVDPHLRPYRHGWPYQKLVLQTASLSESWGHANHKIDNRRRHDLVTVTISSWSCTSLDMVVYSRNYGTYTLRLGDSDRGEC